MATSEKITVKGGCHCGHIRYICLVKPGALEDVRRCNCSYCQKLATSGPLLEAADFTPLSPSSTDEIGDYWPKGRGHRYFCQNCGVHVWMQVTYEMNGKTINHFNIGIRTIDQPQEGIELDKVKFRYVDGLHDNFNAGLKDTPWPGGLL